MPPFVTMTRSWTPRRQRCLHAHEVTGVEPCLGDDATDALPVLHDVRDAPPKRGLSEPPRAPRAEMSIEPGCTLASALSAAASLFARASRVRVRRASAAARRAATATSSASVARATWTSAASCESELAVWLRSTVRPSSQTESDSP